MIFLKDIPFVFLNVQCFANRPEALCQLQAFNYSLSSLQQGPLLVL